MSDRCLVFFRAGACDLDAAAESLEGYGFDVEREGDELTVVRRGMPPFFIRLSTKPHVAEEAAEMGAGTPLAAAMRECNARFEIHISDLEQALDEINTLMEVQGALQDVSQGYLFLPWNGSLSEPWRE